MGLARKPATNGRDGKNGAETEKRGVVKSSREGAGGGETATPEGEQYRRNIAVDKEKLLRRKNRCGGVVVFFLGSV